MTLRKLKTDNKAKYLSAKATDKTAAELKPNTSAKLAVR